MSTNPSPTNPDFDPDLEEGLATSTPSTASAAVIPPATSAAAATATAAGAQPDETIAGPELINDNELPLPTPNSSLGMESEDIKGAINLNAYEVKQVGAQKILISAESDNEPRVSHTDTEAGVAGTDESISLPSRDDASIPPPTTIENDTSGVRTRTVVGGGGSTIQAAASVGPDREPDDSTVHMPEAVLVNEGNEGGDVIMVATPVHPALPWWKQPRYRALMFTAILFVAGIVAAVAVLSSNREDNTGAGTGAINATQSTTGEQSRDNPTAAPTPVRDCFADREELKSAVDAYIDTDCGTNQTACEEIAQKYGWPMNSWCVGNVTSLKELFVFKETFNEDISAWDVSRVTDFSHLFNLSISFNQNLSSWNTSSATNFSSAFANASSFNNDISTWDTSSVTDFQALFFGARSFNGDVSRWNTSNVRNLYGTFAGAASYDGDLSLWDVSKVGCSVDYEVSFSQHVAHRVSSTRIHCLLKVEIMFGTFAMALQFSGGGISAWDVSSCTTMYGMFYIAVAFDQNLSNWNTSSVTAMFGTFAAATSFRGDGLETWDVSKVELMHGLFYDAIEFNADLSNWDVSSVVDMSNMFNGAKSFNSPLSSWNISSLSYLYGLFTRAESFNQDLCAWGDDFPYAEASNNFLDSGCTFTEDPTIEDKGPFCASSCLDGQ